MNRIGVLLGSLAVCFVLLTGQAKAASDPACVVVNVSWQDDGAGLRWMAIVCGASAYYAFTQAGTTGCPTINIDSVKLYQSLGIGARLSGKPLHMNYNNTSCWGGSLKTITGIEFKD